MKPIVEYADILVAAPFYLGYLWMADKFCKKYLGISRKKEWLFMIFSLSGWLLLEFVNRSYPISYILLAITYRMFFIGLILVMFRSNREKKILVASMLMMARTLVGNFCASFCFCLSLFIIHTVKKIPEPFLSEWEASLVTCISFCLVIFVVHWMSKYFRSVFLNKTRKWYVILAVPLLMSIAVIDMASWGATHGIMVRSGGNMGLYYDQIFSHIEFCVLTLLFLFAAGFYIFGMEKIYLEQEKSSQYYSQITVYKMLEEQYKQSERLRHDMKNHIIALSGLFQSKEWDRMGSYLKNMEDSSLEYGGDMTGNKAVDALLYYKRKWAEKENVKWECDIQIPKVCCINEFDLCILFGNLLDNALEACERLQCDECRFVSVQARAVKKCFLLEVRNSSNKTEKYARGFTNKENPQEHGIGLLNVRDVVYRYNGVLNIETKNGIFVISILVPLSDAVYDIKETV